MSWSVVTAEPSAVDWLSTTMPRCWGLEPHSSHTESKACLGTDGVSALAIVTLGVVVFFGCGAESGWHSKRQKAFEQSMQQYSLRQLLRPWSEIQVHQEHPRCIESMICQFRVEIWAW